MLIAAIDLGTNTALLLIAEAENGKITTVLREELRSPRMGRDVDASRRISEPSFQRVKEVFLEYKNIIGQYQAQKIIATGTSALRDANNRDEFIARMKNETGIEIEIISGEEEALWTFRGAISGIENLQPNVAVIDIGGGSTELSIAKSQEPRAESRKDFNLSGTFSLDMGAVRVTEKFFPSLPSKQNDIENARMFIREQLSRISPPDFSGSQLVGVAGTVTTLAILDQHLEKFNVSDVAGYTLQINSIEQLFAILSTKTPVEILSLTEAATGREDILLAGTLILLETMNYCGWGEVTASERGLRYGIVLRENE